MSTAVPSIKTSSVLKKGVIVFSTVFFLISCAGFILPLAAAISPLAQQRELTSFLDPGHIARVASFTLWQALGSTGVAVLIGLPTAFFISQRSFPGKHFLASLSSVPLCIPALIIALGYVTFFGLAGSLNRFLMIIFHTEKPPLTFLYSFWGIIIAQGFYNFPLVMISVADSWKQLPHDERDCAKLLGASDARVFRTITLYQLIPAIVSACIPVFLFCFFSFVIVLLFGSIGSTTLEVEIYQAARSTLDFQEAGALALIETLIAGIVITFYTSFEQHLSRNSGYTCTGTADLLPRLRGGIETISAFIIFSLIILFFIAPLAGIVVNACTANNRGISVWTPATFIHLFKMNGFAGALRSTFLTATATGICAVITAFTYASFLRISDPHGIKLPLRIVPVLPMAVSSVITGFGMMMLIRKGSPFLLIVAQTALSWPLAFRQIYTALGKIPEETIDAAKMLSKSHFDTIYRIFFPVSVRSMLSAGCFCFAVSAGDTTLPLVLALPHFDTLALFSYRLAGAYRFHEACAAGLVLGFICALFFAAANSLKEKNI